MDNQWPEELEQVGNTLCLCDKRPEDHPGGAHFGEGLCWISFPGGASFAAEIARRWKAAGPRAETKTGCGCKNDPCPGIDPRTNLHPGERELNAPGVTQEGPRGDPTQRDEGDGMKTHHLKIWPEFFEAVLDGRKTFEVRNDDRGFEVGDVLELREWSPDRRDYTGRSCAREVTYLFEFDEAVVVMAIAPLTRTDDPELDLVPVLEAIARRQLGDEATVQVHELDPLPGWEDLEGEHHPPMPVVRAEILFNGKSFGMEGPRFAAPGFVAYMAGELKEIHDAPQIIAPPAGFKA